MPAVGGVELGAGARHRHPHRRVRLLVGLGQDGARRHRPERRPRRSTAPAVHIFGRQRTNSSQVFLVSSGLARNPPSSVHVAERPVPTSSRPPRQDVEHGRPLGDLDRVVELGHADDDAVADADVLRQHRARGEEQLRRRAVRVLLEEVVLDRPHRVEAQLVGQLHLLERVVVHRALGLAGPRPRHRELVEDSEFHLLASAIRILWRNQRARKSTASRAAGAARNLELGAQFARRKSRGIDQPMEHTPAHRLGRQVQQAKERRGEIQNPHLADRPSGGDRRTRGGHETAERT